MTLDVIVLVQSALFLSRAVSTTTNNSQGQKRFWRSVAVFDRSVRCTKQSHWAAAAACANPSQRKSELALVNWPVDSLEFVS